jgi:hypothetical protein
MERKHYNRLAAAGFWIALGWFLFIVAVRSFPYSHQEFAIGDNIIMGVFVGLPCIGALSSLVGLFQMRWNAGTQKGLWLAVLGLLLNGGFLCFISFLARCH